MVEGLTLLGFGPSVYTRIVRMALIEMRLSADYVEVNPFEEEPDRALIAANPVGRVPVLMHGKFVLSETGAITRYLDQISGRESLVPEAPKPAARMAQVMGLLDAHLYQPLVRKAFSHGVFAPRAGLPHDPALVSEGIAEALPALKILDTIAAEGLALNLDHLSLADLHLAPMMDYGLEVPDVRTTCDAFPDLMRWWDAVSVRASMVQSKPAPYV